MTPRYCEGLCFRMADGGFSERDRLHELLALIPTTQGRVCWLLAHNLRSTLHMHVARCHVPPPGWEGFWNYELSTLRTLVCAYIRSCDAAGRGFLYVLATRVWIRTS